MKNFKLFLLLATFCSCLTFSACSNDDDNGGDDNNLLVGTWRYDFSTGYILLTFNSNGTGVSREYDTDDGGWHEPDNFNYSYNPYTNMLFIIGNEGKETLQITQLTNSILSWYYADYPEDFVTWYRVN